MTAPAGHASASTTAASEAAPHLSESYEEARWRRLQQNASAAASSLPDLPQLSPASAAPVVTLYVFTKDPAAPDQIGTSTQPPMSQSGGKRPAEDEADSSQPQPAKKAKAAPAEATIDRADGSRYTGEVDGQGRPHGCGTESRADGSQVFSESWCHGLLQGWGKKTNTDGSNYEGDFVDGQYHGLGTYRWANGRVYEGEWAAHNRSGLGIERDKDGKVHKCGRWADNKLVKSRPVPLSKIPIGKHIPAAGRRRTLLLPCGGYYCGEIDRRHRQHGLGVSWRPDGGLEQCGRWAHGKLAQSTAVPLRLVPAAVVKDKKYAGAALLFPGGGFYRGDLNEQHEQQGKGVAYRPNGKPAAAGSWLRDRMEGLGITWDENGQIEQCGRFEGGELKEACAVPCRQLPADPFGNDYGGADLLLPHGRHYVGPLNAQSQPHGDGGVEYRADGSEFKRGQWRNGELHGLGKAAISYSQSYKGQFVDGIPCGRGQLTWASNGQVYEGDFLNGLRHGFGIRWSKNGKMLHCGRWAADKHVESCPVPRSHLPVGHFLSSAASNASLLFPEGGFYVGQTNELNQRHGKGSMYHLDGQPQSGIGRWLSDRLQPGRALLIGNNVYKMPVKSLRCCRKDARDMRAALTKLGFQCTLLSDGTRRQMKAAIRHFLASLQPGDIVFIYFSGHGAEKDGRTYLLPVDFRDGDLRDDAVCLEDVESDLNAKDCHLVNIIMLDCCRYNRDDATFRGVSSRSAAAAPRSSESRSFVRKPTNGQFLIAYSSDRGTVAFESGRNGWFTSCALQHLATPGVLVEQMFKLVRRDLMAESEQTQCSWCHMSLQDDVMLCGQ